MLTGFPLLNRILVQSTAKASGDRWQNETAGEILRGETLRGETVRGEMLQGVNLRGVTLQSERLQVEMLLEQSKGARDRATRVSDGC